MSADSMWRDDDIVTRHKQTFTGLDILSNAERRANRTNPSEYRRQTVIDSLFDTSLDEVRANPDKQIGLGDVPTPTKYVAPLAHDVVKSRAVERRRAKEAAERAKTEKFMSWLTGNDKPVVTAHELKFGTQRGVRGKRTALCVCGATMTDIQYDGIWELTCPNETTPQ